MSARVVKLGVIVIAVATPAICIFVDVTTGALFAIFAVASGAMLLSDEA